MTKIATEERGLQRDLYSKAILGADSAALTTHRRSKEMMRKMVKSEDRISSMESEIAALREAISLLQNEINTLKSKRTKDTK